MKNVAIIHLGHSHLAAMIPGLTHRVVDLNNDNPPITHYIFNIHKYNVFGMGNERFSYNIMIDGVQKLNPVILHLINQTIPSDSEVVIATTFGGNVHNALGLLQVQGGIDFTLPSHSDLPIDDTAQVVPYTLLRSIMTQQCGIFLDELRSIRSATTGKIFHIVSPPPIEDNTHISKIVHQDPYFAQAGHNRITPALIRYKMWLLHSEIYIDVCKEYNIDVIFPDNESIVDGKWLSSDCIGPDPTHGNYIYGNRVLAQLEKIVGGRYAGWTWLG